MNKETIRKIVEKTKEHTLRFVAFFAVLSGIATYVVSTQTEEGAPRPGLILVLLNIDLILLFFFCAVVTHRFIRMVRQRRKKEAGYSLEIKFVSLFGVIAMVPTICVSLFSVLFFNIGLQSWFSKQVLTAVNESYSVANAYLNEHRQNIKADVLYISSYIVRQDGFWQKTQEEQEQMLEKLAQLRDIDELIIMDSKSYVMIRVGKEAPFSVEEIPADIEKWLRQGEVVLLNDIYKDRVRAVYMLSGVNENMLLVGRNIDPGILKHIERAEIAIDRYKALEGQKSYFEVTFNLIYLVVALLLLIVAIWFGMTWAGQITEPVRFLVKASEKIRKGEWDANVPAEIGKIEEFNLLGVSFNKMVSELKTQQETLVHANEELEEQRRQIEYVLAGVSAGVVAIDGRGKLRFYNHAATELLDLTGKKLERAHLSKISPKFWEMVKSGEDSKEIEAGERTFSVTITKEMEKNRIVGYILTFDDLTALITAQKKAAWSDIAQRMAHEVKNPLTPLQLAAERLEAYRKYVPKEKLEDFNLYTSMITEKVEGVKRMLDIFSKFAKMPPHVKAEMDFVPVIKEAMAIAKNVYPEIEFKADLPETCLMVGDVKQLSQVLLNVIKNAAEAVEKTEAPEIKVALSETQKEIRLSIRDNGPGFESVSGSFEEPYPTKKEGGSGLGLAIVHRMVKQHDGKMKVENKDGAKVTFILPKGKKTNENTRS